METVKLKSVRLAYARRGQGVPMMLVHGYPLDHSIWETVAGSLERTFDLIMPDLRGFGRSSTVDTPYTMDDLAEDLAGLLDALQIPETIIAGHSMGGYVALAFLSRFPTRTRGLALVSSQTAADPSDRKEGRYRTASEVAENGTTPVVAAMAPKLSANPDVQQAMTRLMEKQSAAGIIGALRAMAERRDASSLLMSLRIPVTLVHGDADLLIPIDRAREVKAVVPHAHLVELAGVGHMPMLDAPAETAAALSRFATE